MPNLNLTHNGNMNITSASIGSGGTLNVQYEPNTTGDITGWTHNQSDPLVCGETYTIILYPQFSGTVLTENFIVSGYDVAGVQRSDTSVLRQGYDSNLLHYDVEARNNSTRIQINSSSATENYVEINATVVHHNSSNRAGFPMRHTDSSGTRRDIWVYFDIIDPVGPDTGTVASSLTLVVADSITGSSVASAIYAPSSAVVDLSYGSAYPTRATIDPITGEITVLQNGWCTFYVEDRISGLIDAKTVTIYVGDTPGPDTGDTGVTALTISVADEIIENGIAVPIFSPSTAETSFVFTSSDDSIATIDSGGNITVLDNGLVTFCVEETISGMRDCKEVSVRKAVYIDSIEIVVADTVVLSDIATANYTPTAGTVSLVYTSSDPDKAFINPMTGEIVVYESGEVTFCVRDLYTNKSDCKTVNVMGPDNFVQLTYNVTSTSEPTLLFSNNSCCGDHWSDFSNFIYYNGVIITPNTKSYTFPETGEQTVYVDFKTYEDGGRRLLNNCIFRDNTKLVKVKFPVDYNVQATGNYTFYGCTNLREADLSCFTEIDYACFYNCHNLSAITIPNVESIGESAFINTKLRNVYGPKVTFINTYAFKDTRYLETAEFPVLVKANDWAFRNSNLYEFTVPATATYVERAFYECGNLRNLTFLGTTPPGNTFGLTSGLYNLMNIWVPCESISAYKNWLMSDGDSIPLNGYSIRSKVRCRRDTSIGIITATYDLSVNRTLVTDRLVDDGGWGNIYIAQAGATGGTQTIVSITDSDGNEIGYTAPGGVPNPNYYTVRISIDLNAANAGYLGPMFARTGLISVNLPEGLNNVGKCMFLQCTKLKSITLPSTVTRVNNLAFYQSADLSRIVSLNPTEPALVTFTGTSSTDITYTPFYGIKNNGTLYTPSGSTYSNWMKTSSSKPYNYLGTKGWNRSNYVLAQSITLNLPSSIVDFDYASVSPIPSNASLCLSYESSNTSILKTGDNGELVVYRDGEVTITVIDTFSGERDSQTVYVMAGEFAPTAQTVGVLVNVTSTGDQRLYTSSNSSDKPSNQFQRVYLEDGTNIPFGSGSNDYNINYSFQQTGLTKVLFELKTTDLGTTGYTSYIYGKVEKVYISSGVRAIRNRFSDGVMSTVILPEGLTDFNFTSTEIESIVVPSSVTKSYAYKGSNRPFGNARGGLFNDCKKLKNIVFTGPISLYRSFNGCTSLENVDISFASSIRSTDGSSLDGLFYNCTSLTGVTFPSSMSGTLESYYMFANCVSLKEIMIPSYFTTLQQGMFYKCSSLKDVVLSQGVASIGEHTFDGCTSLSEITLPSSMSSIGQYSFEGCTSLERIDSYAMTAPNLSFGSGNRNGPFVDIVNAGELHYPSNATGYSNNWLDYGGYYRNLGYFNWTGYNDL